MEDFIFKLPKDIRDERSVFANRVCKLIYNHVELNINSASPKELKFLFKKVKPFYESFEDCLNNFYEIVENEVPLIALYLLRNKNTAIENYGFQNEQEYQDAWQQSLNSCITYYTQQYF